MKNETQTEAQDDFFQKDAFLKDISRAAGVQLIDHGSLCLFQFFNERTPCYVALLWGSPSPSLIQKIGYDKDIY